MEHNRILKMTTAMLAATAVGAALLIIYVKTGFGIPCVFHELTGLSCPGCGNTHAVLALLRLDIKGAFSANAMFGAELGYMIYVFAVCAVSYVKKGSFRYYPNVRIIDIVFLILIIIWWIIRNIFSL